MNAGTEQQLLVNIIRVLTDHSPTSGQLSCQGTELNRAVESPAPQQRQQ